MSLKECYDKMGADYEDVLSRLRSEVLVRKFALKNGTPHSRYFSDELGVPNFLINTEQMFAI